MPYTLPLCNKSQIAIFQEGEFPEVCVWDVLKRMVRLEIKKRADSGVH